MHTTHVWPRSIRNIYNPDQKRWDTLGKVLQNPALPPPSPPCQCFFFMFRLFPQAAQAYVLCGTTNITIVNVLVMSSKYWTADNALKYIVFVPCRISLIVVVFSSIGSFAVCLPHINNNSKNSLVIHEGNANQISTMTVTLHLKNLLTSERILMNIGFYINEHVILYKISS